MLSRTLKERELELQAKGGASTMNKNVRKTILRQGNQSQLNTALRRGLQKVCDRTCTDNKLQDVHLPCLSPGTNSGTDIGDDAA